MTQVIARPKRRSVLARDADSVAFIDDQVLSSFHFEEEAKQKDANEAGAQKNNQISCGSTCEPGRYASPAWSDYEWSCHLQPGENGSGSRWICDGPYWDVEGLPLHPTNTAVGFGWWGTSTDGALTKVGEYQDLSPSPFYVVDSLSSNGETTYDLFITGTDNDTNQLDLTYYGSGTKVDIDFQRFIHRLGHDPLDNFNQDLGFGPGVFEQAPTFAPLPVDPNNPQRQGIRTAAGAKNRALNSQDLNVGEDYAIRVEELNAEVSGQLSHDLKYRVKVWGQRKFGERQTNGLSHCFNGGLADEGIPADHPFVPGSGGRSCHVLTRRQEIDWLTEEVTPSVEGRWDNLTVEYSHTVRAFYQDDQSLNRFYTGTGNVAGTNTDEWRVLGFNVVPPAASTDGTLADYAAVPDNLTNYSQLKSNIELSDCTNLYTTGLVGNTHNNNRDTDRTFYGFDTRLMDRSASGFENVVYTKMYREENEFPPSIRYDELGPPRTRVGFITGNSASDIVDPDMFQPPGPQNPLDPANPFIRWLNSGEFGFLKQPVDYLRTRQVSRADGGQLIHGKA